MTVDWRNQKISGNIGIAVAESEIVLEVLDCLPDGVEKVYLFGNKNIISTLIGNHMRNIIVVHEEDPFEACNLACVYVKEKKVQCLMKGSIDTNIFLKSVLAHLRTKERLTHVALINHSNYHKPFVVSDVAMNIAPDRQTFTSIINNATLISKSIGVEIPKIALLAAKEKVEEKMPITLVYQGVKEDFANSNVAISGPLSLDVAINSTAAKIKKVNDEVAGNADILIMPTIEAGNIFYKTITTFTDASVASLIMGASCPIVLTSRADSIQTRLDSIILAMLVEGVK